MVSITGNGLKAIEAVQGRAEEAPVIAPRLAEFAKVWGDRADSALVAAAAAALTDRREES